MPERVHRHEWGQLACVAEVVREHSTGQRRARGGLTREHVDLATGDLLAQERKREAGEVRAAPDATDHDIRECIRELHLDERLLADHGLM